jgi:hypothetical protein
MDMRKATARISLPNEAVKLTLDSEALFTTDTEARPDELSRYELVIEGLLDTEESWVPGEGDFRPDDNQAVILRGVLLPTSMRLVVVG